MEPSWASLTASIPFELAQWPMLLILGGLLLLTLFFLRWGAKLPQGGGALAVLAMGGCALLALLLVWQNASLHLRGTWFEVTPAWFDRLPLHLSVGLRTDGLANLMALLVLFIGTLVHQFSQVYLKEDPFLHRYWAYLSFFTLAMLLIVWADNLLLIYVAWELVGLSSYLLIGFWFKNPQPARASQKAFLINRIGDLGFLMGMMILLAQAGTLDLGALESMAQTWNIENGRWLASITLENGEVLSRELSAAWLTAAGLLIFGGCVGKSAQFPLQVWLPDAMAGPTPVSALIHAATMVAAGIYLMARVFFLLNQVALDYLAFTGTLTALMAALAALAQWDIKRVLAYSTISQLGYMVMALGVGARDMALLHLFTHAFFKAALFLGAGAVIHALHQAVPEVDAQDLRNMGGLRKVMRQEFWLYLLPMLALAGLPLTSGFLSKDGILLSAWTWAESRGGITWLVPSLGILVAGLTAAYMGRHAWLIWGGKPRLKTGLEQLKESPWQMKFPLLLLAIGSLWAPFGWHPWEASASWLIDYWQGREMNLSEGGHLWVPLLSIGAALAGLTWATLRFRKYSSAHPPELLQQHFYQDRVYEKGLAKGVLWVSRALAWFDRHVVDGLVGLIASSVVHRGKGVPLPSLSQLAAQFDEKVIDGAVNGIVALIGQTGSVLRKIQSGRLQQYLALALLGVLLMVGWWWWN